MSEKKVAMRSKEELLVTVSQMDELICECQTNFPRTKNAGAWFKIIKEQALKDLKLLENEALSN